MISRLYLIGFFLLISLSCEKSKTVVITGTVTDEVTGNPVSGASVSLKLDYHYDGAHNTFNINETNTTSESDGSYRIIYDSDPPKVASGVPWPFPKNYKVYATAPGFAGSDLHPLSDEKRQQVDVKLYHYAQLNIHAKNNGIYNVKQGYIWLERSLPLAFMESTEYHFFCNGQNFDSTFIIKNIWANIEYSYGFSQGYYIPLIGSASGSIIAKPDSINDFFIPF